MFLKFLEFNICIIYIFLYNIFLLEEGKVEVVEVMIMMNKEYRDILKYVYIIVIILYNLVLCGNLLVGKFMFL